MSEYTTGPELILNACEGCLQIIITDNEKPLCIEQWQLPGQATGILAPALEQICRMLGIAPKDFRRIACVAGPGSFTGIRLVLATAAAIRRTGKAQLASLDYLQALATSAAQRRGWLYPGKIFTATHARRNLVHFQPYISFGPVIPSQPLEEVRLIAPEAALEIMANERCLVCGSALARYPHIFDCPETGRGPKGAPGAIMMPELVNPDPDALCLLARHGDYFPRDVEPRYTRGCDAVEHLREKKGEGAEELARLESLMRRDPLDQADSAEQ